MSGPILPRAVPPGVVLAAALALASAAHAAAATEPAILLPGTYHGDEVTAASGERWLALVRTAGGPDRLVAVTLRVETVRDEILDEEGAPPTGRRVSAAGADDEVVLLVRDVPGLRAGHDVTTIAADVGLAPGEPVTIARDGHGRLTLSLACDPPTSAQGDAFAPCTLSVRAGERSQALRAYSAYHRDGVLMSVGNDAPTRIVWAGDLNGDGAADLVIDLSEHYNLSQPTLFMGRPDVDGPLLEKVAEHTSTGC